MSLAEFLNDMYGSLLLLARAGMALTTVLVSVALAFGLARKEALKPARQAEVVPAANKSRDQLWLWCARAGDSSVYRQMLYARLFSLAVRIQALRSGCGEDEALEQLIRLPGFRDGPLARLQQSQLRSKTRRARHPAGVDTGVPAGTANTTVTIVTALEAFLDRRKDTL